MVSDGSPYSVIDMAKVEFLCVHFSLYNKIELEQSLEWVGGYIYWQYGSGNRARAAQNIVGSVALRAKFDNDLDVSIRDLAFFGSTQSVNGKDATKNTNIQHTECNVIKCFAGGFHSCISTTENYLISYNPLAMSTSNISKEIALPSLIGSVSRSYSQK